MMKTVFATALATSLLGIGAASAAPAMVTTSLNLRSGPGTGYRVETAMPNGAIVNVVGCTRGYNWCRVRWNGHDGWASSNYLASRQAHHRGQRYARSGAAIGIPLIAGAVIGSVLTNHNHDSHHHDYRGDHRRDRGHHSNRDRDDHGRHARRDHDDHDRHASRGDDRNHDRDDHRRWRRDH
ncbi:SH3 domain-containing protein [Pararhizobium mangrovi]|uniref:Ligand-binding protein SH3 n=1 Tax=Pararhizobium mangrovi TaxID=2590452 RepID=A0A506U183_9HYPH|nr:SH3 domain-containing protein [Pararhizobium mangrovi]TPW26695.1 ligand-binding protein SH3 [Pararhizobium mangrovi]